MSAYTEEDFRNAGFAVLPKYGLRAHKSAGDVYWQRDGIKRATNAEMAEAGWQPVGVHNLHATDALEEEVQDLRDANAGLKTRVEYLDGELVLWQERLWQERASQAEAAPLTIDTLREAWETAESLDACRSILSEGDVLIIKEPHDIYLVRPACEGVFVGRADAENARILHRAPQPEPWEELMGVLSEAVGGPVEPWQAQCAYERGLRIAGGDDRG